ncbi:ATPase [Actinomadura craniellae]|uniref:histidine kinase n=1 Tax=Actinomadura craniellae TaxID=2231787 RepID=A0A365H2V3_9ACTN|nr:PAS domain-containing sensor histidine kinase [Actinomadura craniellae]RAY13427.1 ATPase [Actinomadura craniellae]
MPTLTDLVRGRTDLDDADLEWLHALVSDWQLLADLSFADLVLWVPLRDAADPRSGPVEGWVAIAQMRPTTGPTAYPDDLVGRVVRTGRRGLIDVAWRERRIVREGDPEWGSGIPVREESIPVRRGPKMLGVIQRSTNLSSARTPSRLELTYLQSASDLAQMINDGRFPVPGEEPNLLRSPRVGDGLIRLDRAGRVSYASPNAQSAYRRLGLATDLAGEHLGSTTAVLCDTGEPREESLTALLGGRAPREAEVESNGAVVQLRVIPLVVDEARIGAIVLLRDVTELRWRDRELMTKDATIREIHHRVKNNLQTVAALLRLQARRLRVPEGRAALDEAVRRVGSIAIVHETLSHTPDELIDFDDIADRVIMMAGEVSAAETQVVPERRGSFGVLPAQIATPLAMVLTELLQNALQHGLPHRRGLLEVRAARDQERLEVVVADDGVGLPPDFDVEAATSLGLQIVRTLIVGELGGRLDFRARLGGGTEVVVDVPLVQEGKPPNA